jgi:hypothetical protein
MGEKMIKRGTDNMKTGKKLLAVWLCAALLAGWAGLNAFAAGGTLTLVADKSKAKPGDTLHCTVAIDGMAEAVRGVQFTVQYDPGRFAYVAQSAAFVKPFAGANVTVKMINADNPGEIVFVAVFSKGLTNTGTLAQFSLTVQEGAAGSSELTLSDYVVTDDSDTVEKQEVSAVGATIKLPDPAPGTTAAPAAAASPAAPAAGTVGSGTAGSGTAASPAAGANSAAAGAAGAAGGENGTAGSTAGAAAGSAEVRSQDAAVPPAGSGILPPQSGDMSAAVEQAYSALQAESGAAKGSVPAAAVIGGIAAAAAAGGILYARRRKAGGKGGKED